MRIEPSRSDLQSVVKVEDGVSKSLIVFSAASNSLTIIARNADVLIKPEDRHYNHQTKVSVDTFV
jgi:hypothetical protein